MPSVSRSTQGRSLHGVSVNTKKWRVAIILAMFFLGASLLLLLLWWGLGVGSTSNDIVDSANLELTSEQILQQLQNSNKALTDKLQQLEAKLNLAGEMIHEVHSDCTFYNRHHMSTQVEHGLVEIHVDDWNAAVKNGLQDASISFEAGDSLGRHFHSSWTFYLSSKGGFVHVHLVLDKWSARETLWAGYTVHLYGAQGQRVISRSAPVTNALTGLSETDDGETVLDDELTIPNLVSLNNVPQLLRNGSLTLKAELELIGYGHRIYTPKLGTRLPLQKDTQNVVFAVDTGRKPSSSPSPPNVNTTTTPVSDILAYSTFQLTHPWGTKSSWSAQVDKITRSDKVPEVSFSLSLIQVEDDAVDWDQFWAIFKVQESISGILAFAPLHNYMAQPHLTIITNLLQNHTTTENLLEFGVSVTVFNRNARFYVDLR